MREGAGMVDIHELTLRDGLMAQPRLPIAAKLEIVEALLACGIRSIEASRFPLDGKYAQFDDTLELLRELQPYRARPLRIDVFAFGEEGVREALRHADAFDHLHVPCFMTDEYARYAWGAWDWQRSLELLSASQRQCERAGTRLTVGVGTVFGCPFAGEPRRGQVTSKIAAIADIGVTEIMIGDTIGIATPAVVRSLMRELSDAFPSIRFRAHFHDAYGRALLNTFAAIEAGVHAVDTSLLGLGGEPHPYFLDAAMTANGNCSTEELLALSGASPETLATVFAAARRLATHVGAPPSRASFAELIPYELADALPAGH